MGEYLVERHLAGISPEALTAAARAARDTTVAMQSQGTRIEYLGSTYVPNGDRCLCLFDADSVAAVEEANRRADLPFERIVEAAHLAPEELTQEEEDRP